MNIIPFTKEVFPVMTVAIVTAGLICPPDICAVAYTRIHIVNPFPSAIAINLAGVKASDDNMPLDTTTPAPRKTKRSTAINSATPVSYTHLTLPTKA